MRSSYNNFFLVIFLTNTLLFGILCGNCKAVKPSGFKSPFTAKQYFQDVKKIAKERYSNFYLIWVDEHDIGYDFLNEDGLSKQWRYYFKNANEGKTFTVILDEKRGLVGVRKPMIIGGLPDKGDIASKWRIDSDEAYKIALENGAAERAKIYKVDYISYNLGSHYIRGLDASWEGPKRKVVWEIEFSYGKIKGENLSFLESRVSDLKFYIDAQTGEVLHKTEFQNMSDRKSR